MDLKQVQVITDHLVKRIIKEVKEECAEIADEYVGREKDDLDVAEEIAKRIREL